MPNSGHNLRQRTISPRNQRRCVAFRGDTNDTLTSPLIAHEVLVPKPLSDDEDNRSDSGRLLNQNHKPK